MGAERPKFLAAGDTALVVEFGTTVDPEINHRVMRLGAAMRRAEIAGIVDLVPTFRSLMVHYDPTVLSHAALEAEVHAMLDTPHEDARAGRLWRVPVVYGGEYGPDLEDVAARTGLSPDAVIERHISVEYEVYMMGFLPGLPYLGILPEELALPRRTEPRVRVPAGSVAMATNLANIYPSESPGGWHILGRTPIELFDLRRDVPILLDAGDRIRFEPIDRPVFDDIRAKAETGDPVIAPEVAAS
jgi:KipI family sensor histidine kinase inhibitor